MLLDLILTNREGIPGGMKAREDLTTVTIRFWSSASGEEEEGK